MDIQISIHRTAGPAGALSHAVLRSTHDQQRTLWHSTRERPRASGALLLDREGLRRGLGCPAVRAICSSAAPLGADRNGRVLARAAALSPCISAPVPASSRAPQSQSWLFPSSSHFIFRTSLLRYGQRRGLSSSAAIVEVICPRASGRGPDTAAVGPYLVRNSSPGPFCRLASRPLPRIQFHF